MAEIIHGTKSKGLVYLKSVAFVGWCPKATYKRDVCVSF